MKNETKKALTLPNEEVMTDEELTAIEAHAQAVDSRMSENCLRLIECLKTCRAAKGLLSRRLEVAARERDEPRQNLDDCNEDRERACAFERRFEAERDEAQEAAEEYWEAWQDALRRADNASLDAAYEQTRRQLAEENAAKELEFRTDMEREWVEMKAERDRLCEALKRYGIHLPFCGHGHCSANPCTCGLASVLENH